MALATSLVSHADRPRWIVTERVNVARIGISVVAALLTGFVAHDVLTAGPLSTFDAPTVAWFSSIRNVLLDNLMNSASLSGGPLATSIYAAILIASYLVRRQVVPAFAVGAIVYGAALVNVALKYLVHRGRPVAQDPLITLATFSFPSGHAAASTVFGGLVGFLVLRSKVAHGQVALAVVATIAWVVLVCTSRVYLGLHYPTDIIAGVGEGVCWLMLATLALDRLGIDLRWASHAKAAL